MNKGVDDGANVPDVGGLQKKPYQKPRIVSSEMLEVVAATCDGGKAELTFLDNCGTTGPIAS